MKHILCTEDRFTALHSKAIADDGFTRLVSRYRQEQDKHLRPAHLVAFEEGDHSAGFSERALEKIARDVVGASSADMKVYDRIADGYESKPAAESMVGRLALIDYTGTGQQIIVLPYSHRDGDCLIFGKATRVKESETRWYRWLPAHAVPVPHDRPLMWLTRLDIEVGVLDRPSAGIARVIINQSCFAGEIRRDGSSLADYLPEA